MLGQIQLSAALAAVLLAAGCGSDSNNATGDPCTGAATRCQNNVFQVCKNGHFNDMQDCANAHSPLTCDSALGCIQCAPAGTQVCVGDEIHKCNGDNTLGDLVQICDEQCKDGVCVSSCDAASGRHSYIGCEYWAIDLDQGVEPETGPPPMNNMCDGIWINTTPVSDYPLCHDASGNIAGPCDYNDTCGNDTSLTCSPTLACLLDAQRAPFAIVVANPDGERPVDVTLSNAAGMTTTITIPPAGVQPIFPQMLGFPDASLEWSGIETKAYKLTSTLPVAAYQFNPLNNVGVFSNDASLLLPANTLDTTYYGLSWPTYTRGGLEDTHGYLTAVATSPGTTNITVTATGQVRPGRGTFPAIMPGETKTFALQQFQSLNLEADEDVTQMDPTGGWDLTGTKVTGDQKFALFGGHQSAIINDPADTTACCLDHLEEQLFPVSTWGNHYAVARSQQRDQERDLLRVLVLKDDTKITINPPASIDGCGLVLAAGDHCDMWIDGDTEITATDSVSMTMPKPIMVGHYITAVNTRGPTSGDPSMSLAVPVAQFRKSYAFLIPIDYANNYAFISASQMGPVFLDGTNVTTMLTSFGSGVYAGGRFPLQAGPHRLECSGGCGLEVAGWSHKVSYMFPGGLDLAPIVVP
jgi:hypothetical protein